VKAGVDLGGTKIQAVVTGGGETIIGEARRETPREGGAGAVLAEIASAVREAAAAARLAVSDLDGVGVGAPGNVDTISGTVEQVSNIDGWLEPYDLGPALADDLGIPAAVGNDVTVAVDAERLYGAGRPYDSFLGVFWGTGVGAGIVLNGRTVTGRGSAGEIGHVCAKAGGRRCGCGLRGCVEAYAGRGALEARARIEAKKRKTVLFDLMNERGRDRLTSGIWLRALEVGDEVAVDLLEQAVQALGVGIGSAVTLLDVEAVVVGGGLGERLGPVWLEKIEQAAACHTFFDDAPAYVPAELGDHAGAIGASLLVR
jgi:glucokinase